MPARKYKKKIKKRNADLIHNETDSEFEDEIKKVNAKKEKKKNKKNKNKSNTNSKETSSDSDSSDNFNYASLIDDDDDIDEQVQSFFETANNDLKREYFDDAFVKKVTKSKISLIDFKNELLQQHGITNVSQWTTIEAGPLLILRKYIIKKDTISASDNECVSSRKKDKTSKSNKSNKNKSNKLKKANKSKSNKYSSHTSDDEVSSSLLSQSESESESESNKFYSKRKRNKKNAEKAFKFNGDYHNEIVEKFYDQTDRKLPPFSGRVSVEKRYQIVMELIAATQRYNKYKKKKKNVKRKLEFFRHLQSGALAKRKWHQHCIILDMKIYEKIIAKYIKDMKKENEKNKNKNKKKKQNRGWMVETQEKVKAECKKIYNKNNGKFDEYTYSFGTKFVDACHDIIGDSFEEIKKHLVLFKNK